MTRFALALVLASALMAAPLRAADDHHNEHHEPLPQPRELRSALSGNTIAFLANISYATPVVLTRGQGAVSVGRLHLIAYLNANGAARIKRWNEDSGVYEAVVEARWTIEDSDRLCLNTRFADLNLDRLCLSLQAHGPVIAGHGIGINALIKGNVRPGNPDGL